MTSLHSVVYPDPVGSASFWNPDPYPFQPNVKLNYTDKTVQLALLLMMNKNFFLIRRHVWNLG